MDVFINLLFVKNNLNLKDMCVLTKIENSIVAPISKILSASNHENTSLLFFNTSNYLAEVFFVLNMKKLKNSINNKKKENPMKILTH